MINEHSFSFFVCEDLGPIKSHVLKLVVDTRAACCVCLVFFRPELDFLEMNISVITAIFAIVATFVIAAIAAITAIVAIGVEERETITVILFILVLD